MKQIIMPKLGLTMEEGTIARWFKGEGDEVRKGEILFEVETDKATNEIEASFSGTIGKIILEEGKTAQVLQVIAYILEPGEEAPHEWPQPGIPPQVAKPSSVVVKKKRNATPIAIRVAREREIDLEKIKGTGEGGLITKEDVRRFEEQTQPSTPGPHRPKTASPRAKKLAKEKGISLDEIQGSGPGGRIVERDVREFTNAPNLIQPSRLQQITAERLSHSFSTAPHFYLKVEVDASRLVSWREKMLPTLAPESGINISYTDLLIVMVAKTLKKHPWVNASWVSGCIRIYKAINVGLAIAIEEGLTVPVLKNADEKTIQEIARERRTLTEKAKAGKLSLEDMEEGTFTLTNLGMFGIDEFAAIINPPQSAILAVGRIAERVIAEDGQVMIRPTVCLTLTVDHRVLGGAEGARFLGELKSTIEAPDEVLEACIVP